LHSCDEKKIIILYKTMQPALIIPSIQNISQSLKVTKKDIAFFCKYA